MNPLADWPTPDEERQLLAALASGDRTAHNALAVRFLPLLTHHLGRAFPHAPDDLRNAAADRALVALLCGRTSFDPARGGLGKYLRMAARGDLRNLLGRESRTRRGIPLDSVAEPDNRRNNTWDEELTFDHPRLAAERAAFDPDERTTFELMRGGARETAEFVAGLKLEHLAPDEQVRRVRRLKGRVMKRLVRSVEDLL